MPKKTKLHTALFGLFAILLISSCINIIVLSPAEVWAKPAVPPANVAEPYEIVSPAHTPYSENNDCSPIIDNYKGPARLFWYDSVENAMWFMTDETELYNEFCVFLDENPVPSLLDVYYDRVTLHVDVTFENYESLLNDWYLVDIMTEENIGKLTNNELEARYNIEKNHKIVNKGKLPDTIYLSSLSPNIIYSYTPQEEVLDYPVIINDIAQDCILYTKHDGYDPEYGIYACPSIMIDSTNSVWSCAMYEEGDSYRVMYTKADTKSLYNLAKKETVSIDTLKTNQNPYLYYMYIYNETDTVQTLNITQDIYEENPSTFTRNIRPGQLIGCWSPAYRVEVVSPSLKDKST